MTALLILAVFVKVSWLRGVLRFPQDYFFFPAVLLSRNTAAFSVISTTQKKQRQKKWGITARDFQLYYLKPVRMIP